MPEGGGVPPGPGIAIEGDAGDGAGEGHALQELAGVGIRAERAGERRGELLRCGLDGLAGARGAARQEKDRHKPEGKPAHRQESQILQGLLSSCSGRDGPAAAITRAGTAYDGKVFVPITLASGYVLE